MIHSVFVFFFLQNCLYIKLSFLNPTFKKSKNLQWSVSFHTILIGSCPDGLPRASCHDCCPRDQPRQRRTLSTARGDFPIFDRCGGCMDFFSPGGENQIFWNGRIVLSEPRFPFWEQVLLLVAKGGRTALSEPQSRGSGHLPGAADTAAASRMEAGRSRSQNCALESHEHPTRETKNKTNSTEKVERLRDNRRGLRVVIYNRDCKMVNQIWS